MATLKENYVVQKRNILNEIRSNNMTLQELRFFSIYLSKINKDKPDETRVVRFPIEAFKSIMDLGRLDINYLKGVTNGLLCKVVNVPIEDENGRKKGYTAFQLFKECTVSQDDFGKWYVDIDSHDKALPLMFEFKNKYFSYQLWNALRLRSPNQLRMYEILKQYEKVGERILSIEDLRSLLGVGKNEYEGRWNNFKKYVLDACKQALAEYTDIKFTYESFGKKGKGGKILALKFIIEKNENYADQLTLDTFIEQNNHDVIDIHDEDEEGKTAYQRRIEFFMEACNGEFTFDEVVVLQDKMRDAIPYSQYSKELFCFHYIGDRYKYMEMKNKQRKIAKRFGYMKSLMNKEI